MFIFGQNGTADKDGKRGHFGKRGGHRGGHEMMFRGLDLTDEQKVQMKTIRQASKETTQPICRQMKANREKLQTLSESGNFDEAQVQAIAAEQGALSAQIIVAREKVRAQMFAILTPEQKTKAAELKAQFKQKREDRKQNRQERREAQTDSNDSTN